MDINNNLQHTNTFLGGMNTDVADYLMPDNQYRYAENIRITNNSNLSTGEVVVVNGVSQLSLAGVVGKVLDIQSIRNYVTVITKRENTWNIFVNDNYGEGRYNLLFTDWCTTPLWNSGDDIALSTVINYESDTNVKLYIADNTGEHTIMICNITLNDYYTGNISLFTPNRSICIKAPTILLSTKSGLLKPARVQYAYRLYTTGQTVTKVSPLSKILSIGAVEYNASTGCAVDITIPKPINSTFDKVLVYRITYQQIGQQPSVVMVKDTYIDSTITITDNGSSDVQTLSLAEFIGLDTITIYPKIIETKDNYLFAANVKYDIDTIDKLFENIDTVAWTSGQCNQVAENVYIKKDNPFNHDQFTGSGEYNYNKEYWKKPIGEGYGGLGDYVSWQYVQKEYNESDLDKLTFKCGEIYRFGIRFFTEDGKSTSVKWIADIMIPSVKDLVSMGFNIPYNTNNKKFYGTGIQFSIDQFAIRNLIPEYAGFEIVRCERKVNDKIAITQGMIGYAMHRRDNNNVLSAPWFITLQNQTITPDGGLDSNTASISYYGEKSQYSSNNNIVVFASPEYAYQSDDVKNVMQLNKRNIKINPVIAYTINTHTEKAGTYSYGGYNYIVTKEGDDLLSYGYTWDGYDSLKKYNVDGEGVYTNYTTYTSDIREGGSAQGDIYYSETQPWEAHAGEWTVQMDMTTQYITGNKGQVLDTLSFEKDVDGGLVSRGWSFRGQNLADVDGKTYNEFKRGRKIDNSDSYYCGYFTPLTINSHDFSYLINRNINIDEISYPKSPEWNTFSDKETIRIFDDVTAIGDKTFIPWAIVNLSDEELQAGSEWANYVDDGQRNLNNVFPLSTAGKYMLLKSEENIPSSDRLASVTSSILPISVVNITKIAFPYGGYNKQSIDNSVYRSYGEIIYKTQQKQTPDLISVFSGDTYICMFKYNASHMFENVKYPEINKLGVVYEVPIETDINLDRTYGDVFTGDKAEYYWQQDKPAMIHNYVQTKDAYMYNTAYSAEPTALNYTTVTYTDISSYKYDSRIYYSNVKSTGETIDSWLQFKAANFLDVEPSNGEITQLSTFNNRLMFWQNAAFGILSVNERQIVQSQSDANIILGNGGVLDRYDYISKIYGMKANQFCDDQSDSGLYWWDSYNKEIVSSTGQDATPLSTMKNIKHYLTSYDENEIPKIICDVNNKEVIASVVNDESVIYDEKIKAFSSIYTFSPEYHTKNDKRLILTKAQGTSSIIAEPDKNSTTWFTSQDVINPKIRFIINKDNQINKVFDIAIIGGNLYRNNKDNIRYTNILFDTDLNQHSESILSDILTDREYDYRLNIPRAQVNNITPEYGSRMRGKVMLCELNSTSNSTDFSLRYVTTKYRISWS